MKMINPIRDLLHRSSMESEGDAPEDFETDVMLVRDKATGEVKRLKAEGGESDATDT